MLFQWPRHGGPHFGFRRQRKEDHKYETQPGLINKAMSSKSLLEFWILVSMKKYILCSANIKDVFVHNWRRFTSNILHGIYCEISVLCVLFRSHLSLRFPDSCHFCLQPPEISFPEFISISPFSVACGLEFRSLLCFLSALNPLFIWLVCPDAPRSPGMIAVHILLWSSQWGFKARHGAAGHSSASRRAAPHFLPFTMWAESRQCPNFRLQSLFSLMILFSFLLSRDEEKWDNCANEAFFFISLFLVLHCDVSIIQHPRELSLEHKLFQSYCIKMACFLLLGNRGGCVVVRGGSSLGRWEVKDCSNFKAMSLCKTPAKIWEKTEFEERWPFHPCSMDWESDTGLASCFKVMSKLSACSFGPWIPLLFFFYSKLSVMVPGTQHMHSPYPLPLSCVYIPNYSNYF